jgi:hypothetical protein
MSTHGTTLKPAPWPGGAILSRLADRNEALAGDLLEGFRIKQSRLWFWRELLGAIITGGFRRSIEVRPIKLVEFPSLPPAHEDFAAKRIRLQTLGLSASPVDGVSGWSIAAIIMLISALEPALWIMLAMGMGVGIAVGLGRVAYRRRHMTAPGADLTTVVLFSHHAIK